ncbi:MAG TPA: LysR substrate-binding domain-containing protein [Burkholderiales bacterium]|nr:LysR substrate-binding domain-containing protein [Burkholderiales bacterium]
MTLKELQYLVALADQRRFVRAAEACHIGQPTLSTQLKKLEDYLGVTLFERNKHFLIPTPVGEQIIERARNALEVVHQIRQLARQSNDPMGGSLRIGVIPTLGPYLVPHLLPAIRHTCPKLHLFLREDLTANLLERLRQGRLDLLLLALPVPGDDIEVMPLFREPFTVALPAEHELWDREEIKEKELAGQNVLLLEEGHCMRDQALAICGYTASDEREELKATSLETLRQMVAAGVGCTLLPALATLPDVSSVRDGLVGIRPFAAPVPTRLIGMAWRHRYPRNQTVKRLAQVILSNLPAAVQAITTEEPRKHVAVRTRA